MTALGVPPPICYERIMSERRRIFASVHLAPAELVRSVLALEHIAAEVRNSQLASVAGDVPINEASVEVWVDADDVERASAVVERLREQTAAGPELVCACGARVPASFARCWSCGVLVARLEAADSLPETPVRRAYPPYAGHVTTFVLAAAALGLVLWVVELLGR